jgi:hypothetical protein
MSGTKLESRKTGRSATQQATGGAAHVSPFCKYKLVTSDATGLNIASGPAVLYGIVLISAGTMAAVYNGVTATGDVVVPSSTATFTYGGVVGIWCDLGITCDWTSGTWLVMYNDG